MHRNGQICQKCAINCRIEGNASNENITKNKNLSGVKSISNSVQGLARYRIVVLISIGRLCIGLVLSIAWLLPFGQSYMPNLSNSGLFLRKGINFSWRITNR